MKTSDDGIAKIEEREGLRLEMYRDSSGLPTIGVGHLLTKDELRSGKLRLGEGWIDWHQGLSDEQVGELLRLDVEEAEWEVENSVTADLTPAQFDCLVSFCFNVGVHAFANSTLVKRLNAGHYDAVPTELRRWIHSAAQVDKGLVNRREGEVAQWNGA